MVMKLEIIVSKTFAIINLKCQNNFIHAIIIVGQTSRSWHGFINRYTFLRVLQTQITNHQPKSREKISKEFSITFVDYKSKRIEFNLESDITGSFKKTNKDIIAHFPRHYD